MNVVSIFIVSLILSRRVDSIEHHGRNFVNIYRPSVVGCRMRPLIMLLPSDYYYLLTYSILLCTTLLQVASSWFLKLWCYGTGTYRELYPPLGIKILASLLYVGIVFGFSGTNSLVAASRNEEMGINILARL